MDVVLRMSEFSMPYPGMTLLTPPVFTLYGDGRAIYNMSREPYASGTRLDLRHAQLTDAQVDALLAAALGPGGLADARAEYKFTETTDMTYTWFEIHAGGLDKRLSAYALGYVGPDAIPDRDAHRALGALAARLRNFGNDVTASRATDAGVFEPGAYEATLSVPSRGVEPTADWPWQDLTPSDFGRAPDGNLVGTVSASHADAVLDARLALGFVATGADGVDYVFRLRPLLPDELP